MLRGSAKYQDRVLTSIGLIVLLCIALVAFLHRPLDADNLIAGFKHLRDVIARDLGLDDADPRLVWEYGQVHTAGPEMSLIQFRIIS